MGGKVWSDLEERHFWRNAIPYSPKRAGTDRARPEKSWNDLARGMQVVLGKDARRDYNGTMLFEHYFQNIESQRVSPNAPILVRQYLKKGEINRNHYLIKRRITTDLVSMAYTASNGDHHNHKSNNEDGKDDKDEVDNDNNPIRVANEATRGATRNSYIQTGISFRESQSTTL